MKKVVLFSALISSKKVPFFLKVISSWCTDVPLTHLLRCCVHVHYLYCRPPVQKLITINLCMWRTFLLCMAWAQCSYTATHHAYTAAVHWKGVACRQTPYWPTPLFEMCSDLRPRLAVRSSEKIFSLFVFFFRSFRFVLFFHMLDNSERKLHYDLSASHPPPLEMAHDDKLLCEAKSKKKSEKSFVNANANCKLQMQERLMRNDGRFIVSADNIFVVCCFLT